MFIAIALITLVAVAAHYVMRYQAAKDDAVAALERYRDEYSGSDKVASRGKVVAI